MKQTAIVLFTSLSYLTSLGQAISERLILTDTRDSLLIKSEQPAFDKEGNYCFKVKQKGREYFLTNHGKFGNTSFIGGEYGNNGRIEVTNSFSDPIDKTWYYRNAFSTKVFGPAKGKLERYMTSGTKSSIAITTSYKDSIYFYANGQLVSKNAKANLKEYEIESDDWCALSENGNSIYYVKKGSLYHLFVNGKKIDQSVNSFNALHINNNGDYTYADGRDSKEETTGYDYMFHVHTKDTVLGPVRTVWNSDLTENNSWYYSGDDNGTDYIIINGVMQKGIKYVSNIIFYRKDGCFYSFTQNDTPYINLNGKILPRSISPIMLPAINEEGDFSFYGIKDYYLYKFINGRQTEAPITKYGVRPTPLYISPKGESIHTFETDDSIYLYQDNKLLFNPIDRHSNFKVLPNNELFSTFFEAGKAGNKNSLLYLEYIDTGYWVYNGTFSRPMLPAKKLSYFEKEELGSIVAGECSEAGFFSVQKNGAAKYQININNSLYKDLELDVLFNDSFIFNDKELTFYGVKGLSIYQFKLSL